jgi:molybdopterin synthase sulfur carrier subunit
LEIQLLPFAQARDLFGFSSRTVACSHDETPRVIVLRLAPEAQLAHLRVALDCEYVTWDTPVGSARELAIIPPVSGG